MDELLILGHCCLTRCAYLKVTGGVCIARLQGVSRGLLRNTSIWLGSALMAQLIPVGTYVLWLISITIGMALIFSS